MEKIHCSSLDRVIFCAHSLRLPIEEQESEFSTRGNILHALAKQLYDNEIIYIDNLEDTKYIQMYVDYLKLKNDYVIEERFSTTIADSEITLSGIIDAYRIDDEELEIVDLKTGFQSVNPLINQLKGYAYLILKNTSKNPKKIKLSIHQLGELKSITLDPNGFKELFEAIILESIKNVTYKLGDYCVFCPSKIHCKKFRKYIPSLTAKSNGEMINILRNKNKIIKLIEQIENKLKSENPEYFYTYYKIFKSWKDNTKAPKNAMTVNEAIKLKLITDEDENIEFTKKEYLKLKENTC